MKKLSLVLILLIPLIAFGQRNFKEGIITGTGDTIKSIILRNGTINDTLIFYVNQDTLYFVSQINVLFSMGGIINNTISDNSGNDNDASIYVRCAEFDGGYFDYGSAAQLTGAMTISFWAKGQSINTLTSGVGRIGNSSNRGYNLGISSNANLTMYIAPDANLLVQATGAISESDSGTWTHYMGQYSPSNYIRVFKNGVQVGELIAGVPASQYSASNSLGIGAWGDGDNNFIGQLADVRIYDTVRTYAEVAAIDTNDLVFWDMLQNFYNDTSYTLTGHRGERKESIIYPRWQNITRYVNSVDKVTYNKNIAYIPYSYENTSQLSTYEPIYNLTEASSSVTSSSTQIFETEERIKFPANDNLSDADKFSFLYYYNDSAKYARYQWLVSDMGDYFDVTLSGSNISNIQINQSSAIYDTLPLFANAGQSNAVGQIDLSLLPDSLSTGIQGYFNQFQSIDTFIVALNNNQFGQKKIKFGYEMSLAKEYAESSGDSIVWCKYAVGGTAIHEWDEWNASDWRYYNLYDSLLHHIDDVIYYTAKKTGKIADLKGLVWYQGESDAQNETDANAYQANLQELLDNFRSYFGDTTIHFYPVQIATTLGSFPYYATVNTAISNICDSDSNADYITGADFSLEGDGLHHDQDGYIELGAAIADTIYINQ